MDKLKKRKEIENSIMDNRDFMTFELNKTENGYSCKPLSVPDLMGGSVFMDKTKSYPTRISHGIYKIIAEEPAFLNEILTAYDRFLNRDWGDFNSPSEAIEVGRTNRLEYLATGYYMTSWGEIEIKRDYSVTTAYLGFER